MSESYGRSSVHGSHLTSSSEGKRRVPGLKPICDQRKKKSLPKLKVSEKLFQKKIFGDIFSQLEGNIQIHRESN